MEAGSTWRRSSKAITAHDSARSGTQSNSYSGTSLGKAA